MLSSFLDLMPLPAPLCNTPDDWYQRAVHVAMKS
jgi:hypothetical protein